MQQTAMLTFLPPSFALKLQIPLASFRVAAGFPSPADDYLEDHHIDLNKHFVRHPAATFYVRVCHRAPQNQPLMGASKPATTLDGFGHVY
jgi:hypothetical protein